MKWKLLTTQSIDSCKIKTYTMPSDTGLIYLLSIDNNGIKEFKTIYSPSIKTISEEIAKIIVNVKDEIQQLEQKNYHKGKYHAGIIPVDLIKEEDQDIQKFKRRKKAKAPDFFPEDFS